MTTIQIGGYQFTRLNENLYISNTIWGFREFDADTNNYRCSSIAKYLDAKTKAHPFNSYPFTLDLLTLDEFNMYNATIPPLLFDAEGFNSLSWWLKGHPANLEKSHALFVYGTEYGHTHITNHLVGLRPVLRKTVCSNKPTTPLRSRFDWSKWTQLESGNEEMWITNFVLPEQRFDEVANYYDTSSIKKYIEEYQNNIQLPEGYVLTLLQKHEYEKYRDKIPYVPRSWWLYTPDYSKNSHAAVVDFSGNVDYRNVKYGNFVRPVLKRISTPTPMPMSTPTPAPQGWQCPICGTVYAPWVSNCTHQKGE